MKVWPLIAHGDLDMPIDGQPRFIPVEEIRSKAAQFLAKQPSAGDMPVPIEQIIEFDLDIEIRPAAGLEAKLGVGGWMTPDMETIFVDLQTFVSKPCRYRFTLAHEIAHPTLHAAEFSRVLGPCKTLGDYERTLSSTDNTWSDRREWQANTFAGLILVPPEALAKRWLITGADPSVANSPNVSGVIHDMAQYFYVSDEVIRIRLANDGLWNGKLGGLTIAGS